MVVLYPFLPPKAFKSLYYCRFANSEQYKRLNGPLSRFNGWVATWDTNAWDKRDRIARVQKDYINVCNKLEMVHKQIDSRECPSWLPKEKMEAWLWEVHRAKLRSGKS